MTYYDVNNSTFYSTPTVSGEFGMYPFLSQTLANEEATVRAYHFTDGRGIAGQSGHVVGSPTGLRAEASFGQGNSSLLVDRHFTCDSPESVSSVTSRAAQTHGYGQPYWPITGQYPHSHYSGIVSRGDSFASLTVASEASIVDPIPRGGKYLLRNFEGSGAHRPRTLPPGYWGANQSEPSTGASYTVGFRARSPHNPDGTSAQNVRALHQPNTGSTRIGPITMWWFRPYRTSSARSNEHRNAQAGPSTLGSFSSIGGSYRPLETARQAISSSFDVDNSSYDLEDIRTPLIALRCTTGFESYFSWFPIRELRPPVTRMRALKVVRETELMARPMERCDPLATPL